MYFPDQEQNKTDGLYQRKTEEQQAMMTAQNIEEPNKFLYVDRHQSREFLSRVFWAVARLR